MNARFLALHLPAFRLERCGYAADEVVVLIGFERNAMRVLALTPAATEAGLRRGMSISQARSLLPDVRSELIDPEEEARDRGDLLRMFESLSDQLQPFGAEHIVLEVSRTAGALGGEPAVIERARGIADRLGHHLQLALTDDPNAAVVLAERDAGRIPPGEQADALAWLPTSTLCDDELTASLRALGIDTLGAFASLDAASIAGRFGAQGLRVHRIARGERQPVLEGRVDWAPDRFPSVQAELAGATTTLQLQFVLPGLLGQLSEALAAHDLAVVQLNVALHPERGNPTMFGVRVGRPTRNPETLGQLMRARLASVQVDAPIESLVIEVREAVPEQGWQPGLTDRSSSAEPLPDVLARLQDALGPQAVFAAGLRDTWSPERAWAPEPFQLQPPVRHPEPPSDDPVALQERWEQGLQWRRPTQILARPELIEVRGEPPRAILRDRGWQQVDEALGPELLSGDWWDPERSWERSYWMVRLDQQWAWIYSAEQHWYLHGWF